MLLVTLLESSNFVKMTIPTLYIKYMYINATVTIYIIALNFNHVHMQVSNFWIGYKLEFVTTKSLFNKDASILKNIEVIKSEINSSLQSLYRINDSPHIMAFKVR